MSVYKSLNWLVELDKNLTKRLAICSKPNSTYGYLRPAMRLLEYSCHGIMWLASVGVAILMSHQVELHEKLVNLIFGLVFDITVIGMNKAVFRRRRPSENHDDQMTILMDKYSFPSGHASRAVFVSYFMVIHFASGHLFPMLIVMWSAAVCMSRILLGRHHVSDVVFGTLLGILEYQTFKTFLWIPRHSCENLIRPIQEKLRL